MEKNRNSESDSEYDENRAISTEETHKRLIWIDAARGFVMFYLVFTLAFPSYWGRDFRDTTANLFNYIMFFFFEHANKSENYMTLMDFGAAAFIFILGLMMSVSYKRRVEKYGKKKAETHIIYRYLILSALGLLIMIVNDINLIDQKDGFYVVSWDVVPAIAAAGWTTYLFIHIDNYKVRMVSGYIMGLIYQLLMIFWFFRDYALASVHGGIIAGFMSYGSISVIASACGDYIFFSDDNDEKKYKTMLMFGILNFVVGLLISFLPGWEATKGQISFTHNLLSIGVSLIGLWVFSYLTTKKNKNLTLFCAFGMNPFFVYFIVEVPNLLIREIIGTDLGLTPEWIGGIILTIIYVAYTSAIMLRLYKQKKVISTEKSAIMMLIVSIALFILIIIYMPDLLS